MTLEAWVLPSRPRQAGGRSSSRSRPATSSTRSTGTNTNVPRSEQCHRRYGEVVERPVALPLGIWTHVATTYDGSTYGSTSTATRWRRTAATGTIADLDRRAPDRRQQRLGRVLPGPDRRGARLQPRADAGGDPGRHDRPATPDFTAPTVTAPTPAAAPSTSRSTSQPTATFSEAMDPRRSMRRPSSSATRPTRSSRRPSRYDRCTAKATLVPTAALIYGDHLHGAVKGGASRRQGHVRQRRSPPTASGASRPSRSRRRSS